MDLIERYIYAVVKHLPAKSRKDIEDELRSLILDALDERMQGNKPADTDVAEVLKELGAPSKVAANYFKEGSYVIGPRFYELYLLILKIAMGAAFFGIAVAFIVQAFEKGVVVADIIRLIGQLFSALLSTIGFITLGFAITERINPEFDKNALNKNDNWNPKDLPQVPKQFEKVSTFELVIGLLFTGIFALLLNFSPGAFGFYQERQDYVSFINRDILNQYLPYMNILFVVSIIKNILLLVDGKYKLYTFIMEIAGTIGVIVLAVIMMSGSVIVNIPDIVDIETKNILFKVLNSIYQSTLIGIVIVGVYELGRHGYRFIKSLAAR